MQTLSGDIEYSVDDNHLTLHTDMGDVMIGPEELEVLADVIREILENE